MVKHKHSVSFLIRKPVFDENELTSQENIRIQNIYWALEKALVYEQHTVVDPSIYKNWSQDNSSRKPTFDYILEIVEAYSTAYEIDVNNKIIYGSQLTIKIINPISGQTVGILNHSSTPCTSGCEFIYNECRILEEKVLKTKYGKPENFISREFSLENVLPLVQKMRIESL